MIDLNNLEEIKKLDPKDVFGSTEMFLDQCRQIWDEGKKISYPSDYKDVKNIVFCGMGGSSYGGRVIQSLFKEDLPVPISTNDDYHLPAYANESSLVILSSYSGGTEETLSCANEAHKRRAKITGITTGGSLAEFLKTNNYPGIIFKPIYNPSGQPRLGTGYSVLGAISILANMGIFTVSDKIVNDALSNLKSFQESIKDRAKDFSKKIYGNIPLVFAAEFLKGNLYIMRNQFNETAKSFSSFSEIPDLNHYLMEGLKNPQDKKLITLFLVSNLYSDSIKKRIDLTKDVVGKNGISTLEYQADGDGKLAQMLNVLSFGGYLAIYLAFLYGQDPSVIPWVDYFKEQLAKSKNFL